MHGRTIRPQSSPLHLRRSAHQAAVCAYGQRAASAPARMSGKPSAQRPAPRRAALRALTTLVVLVH